MERMLELVELINRYNRAYYDEDAPLVSDAEYDVLYDELVAAEAALGMRLPDSPTLRVGGGRMSAFRPYAHRQKLYSMNKAKNMGELAAHCERMVKALGYLPEMTLEYKFDGLTLSITYHKGKLITAATRGDGEVGEDVTEQILTLKTVPHTIPFKGLIEIQGEGIMRYSAFHAYNQTAETPLKNPRNAAAGAIRNLDPSVTASRNLDFVAYNIGFHQGITFQTQAEMRAFLIQNGFQTEAQFETVRDLAAAEEALARIEHARATLDFLIDGAVLKVNNLAAREELGYTEKFPRWSIAYKFQALEMTTVLQAVLWQVSRTSKINPLAALEPVDLAGVTVKRATLNNLADIQKKGVRIGDRVLVRRSGDVIPEIMGVYETSAASQEILPPAVCPACGAPVKTEGVFLYCTNPEGCAPTIVSALDHFASKPCMHIEGFSEKTAEQLYNERGIDTPDKLYTLTAEDLMGLEGFKEKKAKNLVDAIQKSKQTTLARFTFALGIPTVGKKAAKELAVRFGSLETLMQATKDEIDEMESFGEIMAEKITAFFADEKNQTLIRALLAAGITVQAEETAAAEGVFSGKTVVLTGSLSRYKRSAAAEEITARGGVVADTVNKKVNLVVAGEDAGSKLEKAKKLNIEIISELDFVALLEEN